MIALPLDVTAVVPVKNEERNLPRCLACLREFAEVVVIDSGSTDRTPEIARESGAVLLNFDWNGQFPKKRNWCLGSYHFKTDWVLFVDADEYVTEEFVREIRETLEGTSNVGFWVQYSNHFLGKQLRHGDPLRKLALFRVGSGEYERIDDQQWSQLDMEVHEHPILTGTTGVLRARIEHNDFKGLHAYVSRHNEYSTWEARRYHSLRSSPEHWSRLTARQRIKYRLVNTWLAGPSYFFGSYVLKGGFLDGNAGFVFALLKLCYFMQIKAKLYEMDANAERDLVQP